MNIHIIGTGAIGCHIGSVLRSHRHNVTLLLRSSNHLKEFAQRKNRITYHNNNEVSMIEGFKSSLYTAENTPIQSLIVATKAHHTVAAVEQVSDRITSESTILLLQNGMGVVEELIDRLWQNKNPPHIMVGINRHAVERVAPYEIYHHSGDNDPNALNIGLYPTSQENVLPELANALIRIPELNAKFIPWKEARNKMVHKLMINAAINPICAILNTQNKVLSQDDNPWTKYLVKTICSEAYEVLKEELPGETAASIESRVWEMVKIAGNNSCSTVQDVRNHRLTEIDYINGYICKLGKEKNINVACNEVFLNLIHAKEITYS